MNDNGNTNINIEDNRMLKIIIMIDKIYDSYNNHDKLRLIMMILIPLDCNDVSGGINKEDDYSYYISLFLFLIHH